MPDPGPVVGLICQTFDSLRTLAPVLALVLIGFALLFALMASNAAGGIFSLFGILGAVGIAVFALVIANLPVFLGALGAGGVCR
jgi:multisubunit Na+/H+ antiporter MnhB subunit